MKLKFIIITLFFVLINVLSGYANHIPAVSSFTNKYDTRFAIIGEGGGFNPYSEFFLSFSNDNPVPDYMSLMFGSYYRIHKNIKLGAFYKLQKGAKHDNDWVFLNPGWEWADSTNRFENNLIFDITPRFIIPWILNNSSVASFKMRYQYNFYNNQQTILLKPGFTFFKMINRKPAWNGSLAYSIYIPLNFSEAPVYEHGPYINFIYHINKLVKFEIKANLYYRTWTSGTDSIAQGDSYSITEKGLKAGFGIIVTP